MKILIATGGSGGHIFPALRTGCQLKLRGHEVFFAGSLAMAKEKIESAGFKVAVIPSEGYAGGSLFAHLRFAVMMKLAIIRAMALIICLRPQKVIGFGGYGSFPVIVAARLLGCRSMIHEQNVMPGKANALMARIVPRIAVSFKDSAVYFPLKKVIWTGCPCHCAPAKGTKEALLAKWGLDPQLKVVVCLGGSQGSRDLNTVFAGFIRAYAKSLNIQAIHMTGKNDHAAYAKEYGQAGLPAKAYGFIDNIDEVYALADVVVARAGAATVSELGVLGVPSVLVPYPFAGNHQHYNAEVLSKAGAAILVEQKDLNIDSLRTAIEMVLSGGLSRASMRVKTKDLFYPDAEERLALAVEAL